MLILLPFAHIKLRLCFNPSTGSALSCTAQALYLDLGTAAGTLYSTVASLHLAPCTNALSTLPLTAKPLCLQSESAMYSHVALCSLSQKLVNALSFNHCLSIDRCGSGSHRISSYKSQSCFAPSSLPPDTVLTWTPRTTGCAALIRHYKGTCRRPQHLYNLTVTVTIILCTSNPASTH